MKKKTNSLQAQRGMVMLAALVIIAGILALGMTMASRTLGTSHHVRRDYHDERVFNVAEGGSDYARDWLYGVLDEDPNPTQEMLDRLPIPVLPEYNYEELTITKMPFRKGVVVDRTGALKGLRANIQPFNVLSHASNKNSTVENMVRQIVNEEFISLYQYGIYYDRDLEIMPTFPLDYIGRIHTNGDLYVTSHNTLDVESICTAAGNMYNIPKDPTMHLRGKARFKDEGGQWHDMTYDSRDPNWVTRSLEDWDGRVLDAAHGAAELPFPLPTTADPHDIIERGELTDTPDFRKRRYYWRAGLRIIDGLAYDSLGSPVALPEGIITESSVFDYRERRHMEMRNIDISALRANGLVPDNRILYISYSHSGAAVRLINGSQLPSRGLVVATDNPLYIQGHYNNVNKQPASVLCDAFNAYSRAWDDRNDQRQVNQRIALATTMNLCVVTGNKETTPGNYSGGAENLIRMHEKWVGHQLTFRGSLICIWESEQGVGDFRNASYIEAQRDWAFDMDLLDPDNWPVDALAATVVMRGSWTPY